MIERLQRISAFTLDGLGGNPAGVVLGADVDDAEEMLRIAKAVGYSETAFARSEGDGWRVRYFAPEMEVPFCGHATIALGAALGAAHGAGRYALALNAADIAIDAEPAEGGRWGAALRSPPTASEALDAPTLERLLDLFGLTDADLDPSLPPARASAGAHHAVLPLRDGASVAGMRYDFDAGRALMDEGGFVTIMLVATLADGVFHARNAFAAGGVYEDPATGAAAAAFTGLLRDSGRLAADGRPARIEIRQGAEMGRPSRLIAEVDAAIGSGVRVSGATAPIAD